MDLFRGWGGVLGFGGDSGVVHHAVGGGVSVIGEGILI